MYKPNPMGPWPIVDPSQSKVVNATATLTETDIGSDLQVWLDTANLGSKSNAFANNVIAEGTPNFSAPMKVLSFGVCLEPLDDLSNSNTYVDISMKALAGEDQYDGKGITLVPWVGFIKTAGAAIANGCHANNLVTDYCLLPKDNGTFTLSLNTQVLLSAINSSGLDLDKFLCVGFSAVSKVAAPYNYFDYTISANYATRSIATNLYRG